MSMCFCSRWKNQFGIKAAESQGPGRRQHHTCTFKQSQLERRVGLCKRRDANLETFHPCMVSRRQCETCSLPLKWKCFVLFYVVPDRFCTLVRCRRCCCFCWTPRTVPVVSPKAVSTVLQLKIGVRCLQALLVVVLKPKQGLLTPKGSGVQGREPPYSRAVAIPNLQPFFG